MHEVGSDYLRPAKYLIDRQKNRGCPSWIHIEPCAELPEPAFRQILEDVRELRFAA